MKPVWNQLKTVAPAGIVFREVDGDETRTLGINGFPTIVAEVNGLKYTYRGGPDYNTLKNWLLAVRQG